jgi:heme/copper-type cytochrome/quinol oxidase subunit 4
MKATDRSREHVSRWLVAIPSILTFAFGGAAYRLLITLHLPPGKYDALQRCTAEFLVVSIALVLSLWCWLLMLIYQRAKRRCYSLSEIQKQQIEA